MLSAILAILQAVLALGVVASVLVLGIKYAIPFLTFAFEFVASFLSYCPEWVAPFVLLSVGLCVVAFIVRII